ncbi:trichohyalin-like [Bombina bombina]|uniref:trichohyalin-like n=1 Tax=Bombina bombina TaxID=8345 RepID=UPI00235AE1D4|nr:trichohyalin-like [Bombina bombina]
MGGPEDAEPQTPGNAITNGEETTDAMSGSNRTDKESEPCCLRVGFVRLFLKRTRKRNNFTEEGPPCAAKSLQNPRQAKGEEEREGVIKSKDWGGGFLQLHCLRTSDDREEDNRDEDERRACLKENIGAKEESGHSQREVEEEARRCSKVSLVSKIRGYRLRAKENGGKLENNKQHGQEDIRTAEKDDHKQETVDKRDREEQDTKNESDSKELEVQNKRDRQKQETKDARDIQDQKVIDKRDSQEQKILDMRYKQDKVVLAKTDTQNQEVLDKKDNEEREELDKRDSQEQEVQDKRERQKQKVLDKTDSQKQEVLDTRDRQEHEQLDTRDRQEHEVLDTRDRQEHEVLDTRDSKEEAVLDKKDNQEELGKKDSQKQDVLDKRDSQEQGVSDKKDNQEREELGKMDSHEQEVLDKRDSQEQKVLDKRDSQEQGVLDKKDNQELGKKDRQEQEVLDKRDSQEQKVLDKRDSQEQGVSDKKDNQEQGVSDKKDSQELGKKDRQEQEVLDMRDSQEQEVQNKKDRQEIETKNERDCQELDVLDERYSQEQQAKDVSECQELELSDRRERQESETTKLWNSQGLMVIDKRDQEPEIKKTDSLKLQVLNKRDSQEPKEQNKRDNMNRESQHVENGQELETRETREMLTDSYTQKLACLKNNVGKRQQDNRDSLVQERTHEGGYDEKNWKDRKVQETLDKRYCKGEMVRDCPLVACVERIQKTHKDGSSENKNFVNATREKQDPFEEGYTVKGRNQEDDKVTLIGNCVLGDKHKSNETKEATEKEQESVENLDSLKVIGSDGLFNGEMMENADEKDSLRDNLEERTCLTEREFKDLQIFNIKYDGHHTSLYKAQETVMDKESKSEANREGHQFRDDNTIADNYMEQVMSTGIWNELDTGILVQISRENEEEQVLLGKKRADDSSVAGLLGMFDNSQDEGQKEDKRYDDGNLIPSMGTDEDSCPDFHQWTDMEEVVWEHKTPGWVPFKVEVEGMVQWLVQEATDRLGDYVTDNCSPID